MQVFLEMTQARLACNLPRMDIKERISELLVEHEKNMSELATHCGVSPQAVQQWIAKGRMPRPERLRQIADFFGVSQADLFLPAGNEAAVNQTADDLSVVLDLLNLYRQVPIALRPRVYKAVRGLIIDIAGIDERGGNRPSTSN